jgi:hypothetical protein
VIDVEKLAREAAQNHPYYVEDPMSDDDRACLEHFARLVMEECAKVCDGLVYALDHAGNEYRREATASQCAAAIRARMPS